MNQVGPASATIDQASHVYLGPEGVDDLASLPVFIDARHCVIARDDGRVYFLEAQPATGGVSALSVIKGYAHPRPVRAYYVSNDGKTLVLADSYPSITILQLPEFKIDAWQPVNQACTRVFFGEDRRCVPVIGTERDINGLNDSLVDLISRME